MKFNTLALLNKTLGHVITFLWSAVILLIAVLFIYVFTGALGAKEPIRVGVIDTGLDLSDPRFSGVLCSSGHKDYTGDGMEDTHGHGTHVAGLIMKYAGLSGYCLVILKYYSNKKSDMENMWAESQAIYDSVQMKLTIVNYSGGGSSPSMYEREIIDKSSEVTFIVAAGNNGRNLMEEPFYPASYGLPNIIVVGALNKEGIDRYKNSNYGPVVNAWEIGEDVVSTYPNGKRVMLSGTSMATAIHTGKIIRGMLHK